MNPTKNRVLVKPVVEEKPKKGDEPKAAISLITGTVEKVGPKVVEVKKGESVKFAPYGIEEIVVDGVKMLIVDEDLILVHGKEK